MPAPKSSPTSLVRGDLRSGLWCIICSNIALLVKLTFQLETANVFPLTIKSLITQSSIDRTPTDEGFTIEILGV
jgi:hypothetical protein